MRFLGFLLKRVVGIAAVMIGVSVITFAISHVIPADPVAAALGDHATDAQIAQFRTEYHLDRPLPEQYLIYATGILHGDLGKSIRTRRSVADDLADSFPATLELSFAALLISIVLGVPAGVWSAVSRGRVPDYVVRLLSLAGGSLPVFWLGLIVIGLFYYQLGWFPGGGRLDTFVPAPPTRTGLYVVDSILSGDFEALRSSLVHLVLPALTLGYFSTAVIARMTRSSMLDVLSQDYMDRSGQGARRAPRHLSPRTPQRAHSDGDDHRADVRQLALRRGAHRNDLQLAGPRALRDRLRGEPRLPRSARGDLARGDRLSRREPRG